MLSRRKKHSIKKITKVNLIFDRAIKTNKINVKRNNAHASLFGNLFGHLLNFKITTKSIDSA